MSRMNENNDIDISDDDSQQPPLWVPYDFTTADWGPSSNKYVAGAYTGYYRPNVLS